MTDADNTSNPVDPERQAFIDGLREMADHYEATPDLPLPYLSKDDPIGPFTIYRADTPEQFAKHVSLLGGERVKTYHDNGVKVTRWFGPVSLTAYASRSKVCQLVEVGQETVEEEEIVTPAVTRTKTVTRPVYEWRCEPVLALTDEQRETGRKGVSEARAQLEKAS